MDDASAQDDIIEHDPSPAVNVHTHNPSVPPYSQPFSVVYFEQVDYTTQPIPLSTHLLILEQLSSSSVHTANLHLAVVGSYKHIPSVPSAILQYAFSYVSHLSIAIQVVAFVVQVDN